MIKISPKFAVKYVNKTLLTTKHSQNKAQIPKMKHNKPN